MRKVNLFLPMTKNIIQKAKNKSIPNHSRLIKNLKYKTDAELICADSQIRNYKQYFHFRRCP